jgi:hypothetical protein
MLLPVHATASALGLSVSACAMIGSVDQAFQVDANSGAK